MTEVQNIEWNGNGGHRVAVNTPYPDTKRHADAARAKARRAVPHPDAVQWTRLDRVSLSPSSGIRYEFTVSRLGREYR